MSGGVGEPAAIEEIPWPQGTPIDVDPEMAAADQTPRLFAGTVLTSAAIAAFATSAIGQRWLAVSPAVIFCTAGLHAAAFAINVFVIGRERYVLPRFWPLRLFSLGVTALAAAAYGAGSAHEASAGQGVLIAAAPVFAGSVPQSPAVAACLVLVPVSLRLVAVPGASLPSFGVTLFMGAIAALLYWIASRPVVQRLRLRSAASATRALAQIAHERSATLSMAMSLHDGLSGLLFAARRKLAAAGDLREAQPIAREILVRASQVVTSSRRAIVTPDGIQAALESLAAALGLTAAARVEHRGGAWDDAELRDVHHIATELLANGAKHAQSTPIDLRIRLDERGITVAFRTEDRAAAWERAGRGLRNIELRAKSRGGQLALERRAGAAALVVRWPHAAEPQGRSSWPRMLGEVAVAALAIAPLSLKGSLRGGILVTVIACTHAVLARRAQERMAQRERERLDQARAERREAEDEGALRLVESACGPSLAALERAARDGPVSDIRAAVEALSGILTDLLWALEWSGSGEALAADLADLARAHGAPPPTAAELDAVTTPAARYETRRRLCAAASA